jgi:hypothetical protein
MIAATLNETAKEAAGSPACTGQHQQSCSGGDPMGTERDPIMEIATLILPRCRDGNYGCRFD